MKTIYETVDGTQFQDKNKAIGHENKLSEKAIKRFQILKEKEPFKYIKDNEETFYITVAKDYDDGGISKGDDVLKGNKTDIMRYISFNNKYWFYEQMFARKTVDKTIDVSEFFINEEIK